MSSCQFTSAEIHNIIKFIVQNLLKPIGFAYQGVWGMVSISLPTKLVDQKFYGI